MPFNSLGDLSRPISDDDLTKLEELNKLLEEFKTLGPQPPAAKPGTAPSDSTAASRIEDYAGPGTFDHGKSPWFDRLMQLYRNDVTPYDSGAETDELGGGRTPWFDPSTPGATPLPPQAAPQASPGFPQPMPAPTPIALKQYTAPGGATYTVDDSVGPQFQDFFKRLHDAGIDPKEIQGHNPRNIAGTNIPSKHGSGPGVGAVDIDPGLHPEGASGTWGNVDIRALAQQAGLRSLADRGGRRGPDEMHVETPGRGPRLETGSVNRGPRQMDENSGRLDPLDQLFGMGGYAGPTSDPESAMGRLKSDPINRAMLLSTALNMMSGSGGGSALQDLGMALGAGVNSGAQTAKSMLDQGNLEDKQAQDLLTHRESNASHENTARISADSREEVARVRSQAMLERANMIHGPQNQKEMALYMAARDKYMAGERANQIITRKSDAQIKAEADAYAKDGLRGAREAAFAGGGPLAENTSNNAPGTAGAASPAGTPPTGQPGATAAPAQKGPSLQQLSDDPKIGPLIKQDIQTPEGQAKILSKFPWVKNDLDYYNAGNRGSSGTGLLQRFLGR